MVLIVSSPWQAWIPEEVAEDGERIALAVLELQGRFLIGMAQVQPKELEEQLVELEGMATSDRTAMAVAAVRYFIDPVGPGKWRAQAVLKRQMEEGAATSQGENGGGSQMLEAVRKAIDDPGQLDEGERTQIREGMGWFGKILLLADKADGEPGASEAAKVRQRSFLLVVSTGLMVIVLTGVGVVGVALLSIALVMMGNGKLRLAGIAPGVPVQPYLGAFALYLVLMVLADFLSVTLHPMIAVFGMFGSVGTAFLWPRIRGLGWREMLRGFGWRRGKGVVREMVAGVVGYVAMIPVFALGVAVTLVLSLLANLVSGWLASQGSDPVGSAEGGSPMTHPVVVWVAEGDWKIKLAVVFLASGLAPLFEETMFRGALYRVFRERWGFVVSGLASSLIFAAVHPQGWMAIPALTAMGFGFAMIREWRGTLIASMTAHGLHNGILVTTLLIALS
jgi:membrane protease YdiL (CAAX protease family)